MSGAETQSLRVIIEILLGVTLLLASGLMARQSFTVDKIADSTARIETRQEGFSKDIAGVDDDLEKLKNQISVIDRRVFQYHPDKP